ncbi:MAG: VirB3 family type IV secretion system protein [Pseudomonadota bacterium]
MKHNTNNDEDVEGYEVPIYRSLTAPVLLMGLPRNAMIAVGVILAATTLGLHTVYGIPVCFALYFGLRYFVKKDDKAIEVLIRGAKHKIFYRA